MAVTIQTRRDSAADWAAANPVPALGELCIETDTLKVKAGDGVTQYSSLPYLIDSGASSGPGSVAGEIQIWDAGAGAWVPSSALTINPSGAGIFSGFMTVLPSAFDGRGTTVGYIPSANNSYIGSVWSGDIFGLQTRIRFQYNDDTTSEAPAKVAFDVGGNEVASMTPTLFTTTDMLVDTGLDNKLQINQNGLLCTSEALTYSNLSLDGARLILKTQESEKGRMDIDGGLLVGLTTGSQGAGTINVSGGYYVNGTPMAQISQSDVNSLQSDVASLLATIATLQADVAQLQADLVAHMGASAFDPIGHGGP